MKKRLRITGGILRGRNIFIPDSRDLRPVTEKLRRSFFERITKDLIGQNFIDAFAGSGVMGFEALSRGANQVFFLELKQELCSAIKQTIDLFEYKEQAKVICGDILKTIQQALKSLPRTMVFFDPPYNDPIMPQIFKLLSNTEFSDKISFVVVEHHHKHDLLAGSPGWSVTNALRYGETALTFAAPH